MNIKKNTIIRVDFSAGRFLFRKYFKSFEQAMNIAKNSKYSTQIYIKGILIKTFLAPKKEIKEFIEIEPGLWIKNKNKY